MLMNLYVEIKTRDGKTEKHKCVDFPSIGDRFITLYKPGFERLHIPTETVERITQSFGK